MSVQVRPCDLASVRCMNLSVRMSTVVYMSINQSSIFEDSCPLNVEISCSMVVGRFDSLCVVHKVSKNDCIVLYTAPH